MVTIPAQFNGPERSGNGGYVCGLLADEHGSEITTSTLRQPPPLDTPLTWERDDLEVRLVTAGGAIIGAAVEGSFAREAVPCPSEDKAASGLAAYPGFVRHPFDHCFTCGTQRGEGEGLRLFAGPVDDNRTATPWSPHPAFGRADGALDVPLSWAGLDCPGGWAVDFNRHSILLGRMTAQVIRLPRVGEELLATGRLDEHDGRKFLSSTALYTRDGELLGRAEQTWIEMKTADS
ncbi:hypothetical protein [Aeromicrobium sp.]|uniref:hypothetical protein n=1 Tax=Aeromicrobium sp. TaxID=1871063 RepID=UPI003D6A4D9D